MNIIIIGGGSKFGKFAAEQFINDGHNVFVMSHKRYKNMLSNHVVANFNDTVNVLANFNKLTKNIDKIDVFLYLTRPRSYMYGEGPESFISNTDISRESDWIHAIRLNASIPHDLITRALCKMDSSSRIIFMTTGLSLSIRDKKYELSHLAMYAGTKAAQNFLMRAFADNNDKNVTVCSISTHFPNELSSEYKLKAEQIVTLIYNINNSQNGQIIEHY